MTLEEYLKNCFVDRDDEMGRFSGMLRDTGMRILVVAGESGIGKTLLMERMAREAATQGHRPVKVICRDNRNDALFIMRAIANQLGGAAFASFEEEDRTLAALLDAPVNVRIDVPDTVAVASGASFQNSSVRDISVVKIESLGLDRADRERQRREQLGRLSESFIRALIERCRAETAVVFIDDIQKIAPESEHWVWNELLFAVKEGRLKTVLFVLLGERGEVVDEWRFHAEQADLQPLGLDHITLYLERRGIDNPDRSILAGAFFAGSQGKAAALVNLVEAYLKWKENQTRR